MSGPDTKDAEMDTGGYRRFRIPRARDSTSEARLMRQSRMPVTSEALMSAVHGVDPNKFSSWEAFCIWCLLAGRATDVVVFDASGAVITAEGDAGEDEHNTLAMFLHRLLEQPWSNQGDTEPTHTVSAQRRGRWLTGIRLDGSKGTGLETPGREPQWPRIGLLADTPLYHDARTAIATQARHTLRLVRSSTASRIPEKKTP